MIMLCTHHFLTNYDVKMLYLSIAAPPQTFQFFTGHKIYFFRFKRGRKKLLTFLIMIAISSLMTAFDK